MSIKFEINAEVRDTKGKGASRRLRHADKVPAIVYGEGKDPLSITLDHNDIWVKLQQEAFHSHILTLAVDGKTDNVIMRDIQYHPYKRRVMHLDFLRIAMDHALQTTVPLHFINEDIAPGVKTEGGAINHVVTEVEVVCLPKDIPEFIDVDLSELHMGEIVHLSDLKMPAGVEVFALKQGEEHDSAIASIHARKVAEEPEEIEAAGEVAEEPETKEEGGESEG